MYFKTNIFLRYAICLQRQKNSRWKTDILSLMTWPGSLTRCMTGQVTDQYDTPSFAQELIIQIVNKSIHCASNQPTAKQLPSFFHHHDVHQYISLFLCPFCHPSGWCQTKLFHELGLFHEPHYQDHHIPRSRRC